MQNNVGFLMVVFMRLNKVTFVTGRARNDTIFTVHTKFLLPWFFLINMDRNVYFVPIHRRLRNGPSGAAAPPLIRLGGVNVCFCTPTF